MSATHLGDPHQTIQIPARELAGTREAKLAELDTFLAQLQLIRLALRGRGGRLDVSVGAAGQRPHNRSGFWSWPARYLRAALKAFTPGTVHTKTQRS
jgi:hypothetical protein